MAKNITRHVQHIKSVDTTTITVDGQDVIVAKLPEWGDLKDGEIAVNYKDGYETISIRNNNNKVVAFPNINTVNTLIDEKQDKMLIVTATITGGDYSTYYNATLDKTHSEIVAAMQANKNVYIYVPSMFGGAYIQMTQITGTNTNAFFVVIGDELWYCHTSDDDDDNSCTIFKFSYLKGADIQSLIDRIWYDTTNKIVKAEDYAGNVSNVLTFDTTPTANSVNPVTSDGIKTYVDNGDKIQTLTTYQSSTPLEVGDTHDQALSKLSKIIDDNEIVTARALTDLNDTKQDEIEDLDVIRAGAALGARALQTETQLSKGTTTGSGNAVTDISVDNHQITLTKGATFLTEHQDLSAYADGAEYDSTNHYIYLKHGNTRLANPINAADFIKDGMVDTVTVTGGNLVITFNTDSGKEAIKIPLTDIFDPSLYYTKEEIDEHELVTAAALTELHDTKQELLTFDNVPTSGSSNPVTSSGIKNYVDNTVSSLAISELVEPEASTPLAVGDTYDEAFAKLSKIIRDNELATAGALTELHNTKQELLTFDSTPTANSQNPVTSEGIKEYVDDAIDASTPMTEITYSDLVTARNNNNLKPGTWYRITDYTTTTTQENTRSAGHQFDIVLLALSENKLAEEGWAMMHPANEEQKTAVSGAIGTADLTEEGLTYNYFQNSNLSAWKVWYSLDNDKSRFAWADDSVDEGSPAFITFTDKGTSCKAVRQPEDDKNHFYAWRVVEGAGTGGNRFTNSLTPDVGDTIYNDNGVPFKFTVSSFTSAHEGTGLPNGRGVIYRLIDEFNNDIKYDFKNIQFKRKLTNGQYNVNGTETWCYTLNLWYNDMCQDASIVGNTLPNDEAYVEGVYDNIFGYSTAYDLNIEGVDTFAFALGDNVVLSLCAKDMYYGIYSNTIGDNFFYNTIGDNFFYNTIGNSFYSNTIGNSFNENTIGNHFNSNTIENSFYRNTIGDGFNSNRIGGEFNSNTIGNGFNSNTIGEAFFSNTIGNNFTGSMIGGNFNSNVIGNGFKSNTIGEAFYSNTIGNNFLSNTFGNILYSNTFGNGLNSNTIGTGTGSSARTIDYVRYIRVEDGVQFVNIITTATTSLSAYLQNITISQGIAGSSNSNKKTISHPTVNDNFRTTYQSANSRVESV